MVRAGFEVSLVGPMLRAPLFYIGTDFGGAAGRYVCDNHSESSSSPDYHCSTIQTMPEYLTEEQIDKVYASGCVPCRW